MLVLLYFILFGIISLMTLSYLRTTKAQTKPESVIWIMGLCLVLSSGGGMVAMMFDVMCGIIIHAIGRPISRTAFLHVDYRNVTPIDVPLTMRGWASKVEGRKTFVNAELTDPDGTLLAEANGLMVQLLPGQP